MRPIDADALMSAIIFDDHIPCGNAFQHTVLQIEQAPTLETEPAKQWISCSEQMPEPDVYVLAILRDGEMCVVRLYDDGCWIGCRGFAPSEAVTYWMPLPNPPKGGTENA